MKKKVPVTLIPPGFSVNLDHLPKPTTLLVGRKTELAQLTEAFTHPNIHLAVIVAAGGIGKSALTDEWLQQIAEHNYYGKTRVFGWSFYSQGSHTTFTNSQPFFNAVLPFLGVEKILKDEIEKARELADYLHKQPCLLILDGLEPLQYAKNLPTISGELQDSALKEFIACFRQKAGNSFVLLSSRQPLVELKKWRPEHYLSLDLKTLPHDDGAALLQALGVRGNASERKEISKVLNGHALSLVLIGHLLREHHQGDCRYAKELPPLPSAQGDSDAEQESLHAARVLDYYDDLQDPASRCFLQLLGLFDRPMDRNEKTELINRAQHAEPLRALSAKQWQQLEQRLQNSGLLLGKKGTFERLEWDTHPIIRDYFGQKFKGSSAEAFKQAHLVLFDYYQKLPEKEFPDTLEEMQPLYRAVVHGCLAGKYQQALENVYFKRIQRSGERYSWRSFGAYSQSLTALTPFFSLGWKKIVTFDLAKNWQAELLGEVSSCLMSLGRLQEGIEVGIANLELSKDLEDMKEVPLANFNLVDLHIPLGQLTKAFDAAQQAINCVQKGGLDIYIQIGSLCYLATVLCRRGNLSEANNYFERAEALEQQYDNKYLSALFGFWYCTILLDTANDKTALQVVAERAIYSLEIFNKQNDLINMALGHLILARVYFALNNVSQAENTFQQAIQGIQKANMAQYIPPFYLYRADFYLAQMKPDKAQADLNSAWETIERCGMKLYAVDCLLLQGRYCLAIGDTATALNHYEEVKGLIQETGYHLRDAECDLFAAGICQQLVNVAGKNAGFYIQKASKRIEETGQWGLQRVIQRDFPAYLKVDP